MSLRRDVKTWRRDIANHLAAPPAANDAVLVQTDVGPLLFPAWDQVMVPIIRSTGRWEPEETEWLRGHLAEGMFAADVGANVGYHALVMARAVGPTGRVLAFEPDPLNYRLLVRNLEINGAGNVYAIPTAAGDVTGMTEFTRDPVNAGDHRSFRRPGSSASSVIRVPIVRIDDLHIDADLALVLIDTQSFDHRVVKGMASLVGRTRPSMLVEYWVEGLTELGDDPAEVIASYRSLGYDIGILDDPEFDHDAQPEAFVAATVSSKNGFVTLVLTPAKPRSTD